MCGASAQCLPKLCSGAAPLAQQVQRLACSSAEQLQLTVLGKKNLFSLHETEMSRCKSSSDAHVETALPPGCDHTYRDRYTPPEYLRIA